MPLRTYVRTHGGDIIGPAVFNLGPIRMKMGMLLSAIMDLISQILTTINSFKIRWLGNSLKPSEN